MLERSFQTSILKNRIWKAGGTCRFIGEFPISSKYVSSPSVVSATKNKLPFDDGDGNVSFSECYHGMNEEIDKNGTSQWICDIPVAGWASCWATVSAACVYISAIH